MDLQYLYSKTKNLNLFEAEEKGSEISALFITTYAESVNEETIKSNPVQFIKNLTLLATDLSFDEKFKIISFDEKYEIIGNVTLNEADTEQLQNKINGYIKWAKENQLPKSYQTSSSTVAAKGFHRSFGNIIDSKKENTDNKDEKKLSDVEKSDYAKFALKLKALIRELNNFDKNNITEARDMLKEAENEGMNFNLRFLTTNMVANILYPIFPKAFPLTNDHLSAGFIEFDKLNKMEFVVLDKKDSSTYESLEKLRKSTKLADYLKLAGLLETQFYSLLEKNEKIENKHFGIIDKMFHVFNLNSLVSFDSPNTILYGSPGTGKTYTVKSTIDAICQGKQNLYEFVQFHPSYTYEDFIEGIKPKGVSENGNIRFELVNGIFKNFCIKAKNDPSNNYYFIVDEINRANLSAVFGETLSLLEGDYRHKVYPTDTESHETKHGISENLIKTQYSSLLDSLIADDKNNDYESLAYEIVKDDNGKKSARFGIPSNLYFIGMMNDVDKSIDAFDLALRRRFTWIRKDCDYAVIESQTRRANGDEFTNIDNFIQCAKDLNKYIKETLGLGSSYEFGHAFFMKISSIATKKEIESDNIKELFNRHLRPTLQEYLRAFFSEKDIEAKLKEALEIFTKPLLNKVSDAGKLPIEAENAS